MEKVFKFASRSGDIGVVTPSFSPVVSGLVNDPQVSMAVSWIIPVVLNEGCSTWLTKNLNRSPRGCIGAMNCHQPRPRDQLSINSRAWNVIATDNQTAGRGRLDRTWDTAGDCCIMSLCAPRLHTVLGC